MTPKEREHRLKRWAKEFEKKGYDKLYPKQLEISDILCYICESVVRDGEEFFYKHAQQTKAVQIPCAISKNVITEEEYLMARKQKQ